ncbi:hypothetical protein DLREEDagrD3_28650 [Denitratisoma sp. agr-D3]
MPRKPVHLTYVGGKGPRQRIWDAIRKIGGKGATFTEDDIWSATEGRETDIDTGLVRDYRRGLVAAGFLSLVAPHKDRYVKAVYRLAIDAGVDAPRVRRDGTPVTQGLAQEQMWRTLRMHKGDINARELAAYASTQDIPVNEVAAGDYLRNLHLANYLRCTAQAQPNANRHVPKLARYQLVSDTGPRTPMVQRTDAIYDPNLDKVVWIRPITEETAIYGH